MPEDRIPKKVMDYRTDGKQRWLCDVEDDLRTMGVHNWRRRAEDRVQRRQTVRVAKAHNGL